MSTITAKPIQRHSIPETHHSVVGYVLWIFGGPIGLYRFYYGKYLTGLLWFLTLGLFGIGWIVDLFLIPSMEKEARQTFVPGRYDYNASWLLLIFLGTFGVHRFYLNKCFTGLIYLFTFGLFGIGFLYDFFVLNDLVDEQNRKFNGMS